MWKNSSQPESDLHDVATIVDDQDTKPKKMTGVNGQMLNAGDLLFEKYRNTTSLDGMFVYYTDQLTKVNRSIDGDLFFHKIAPLALDAAINGNESELTEIISLYKKVHKKEKLRFQLDDQSKNIQQYFSELKQILFAVDQGSSLESLDLSVVNSIQEQYEMNVIAKEDIAHKRLSAIVDQVEAREDIVFTSLEKNQGLGIPQSQLKRIAGEYADELSTITKYLNTSSPAVREQLGDASNSIAYFYDSINTVQPDSSLEQKAFDMKCNAKMYGGGVMDVPDKYFEDSEEKNPLQELLSYKDELSSFISNSNQINGSKEFLLQVNDLETKAYTVLESSFGNVDPEPGFTKSFIQTAGQIYQIMGMMTKDDTVKKAVEFKLQQYGNLLARMK